ncbi:hypothetical protein Vadar_009876 [Vaccinium darrowii]|uniref:Uncharacterized protein n=1 Tax=Vaccinium darrowii TaxID=229202 RepID=A0ACB7YUC4_9ERIC|nr:hypothetical protein Vadar_009876 [Vaccinium darrowii]
MGKELGYGIAKFYQKVRGEFVFIATDQDVMDFGLGFDVKKRVVQIYMRHAELTNVVGGTQASETIKNKSRPTAIVINEDPDHEDSDDYDPESSSSEDESDVDFHDSDYNLSDDDNLVETIPVYGSTYLSSGYSSSDEEGGSSKRVRKKYKLFNEQTDMDNPQFLVGMEFKNHSLFRDAVKEHGIKNADKVFRVKTHVDTHTCTRSYHVPWVSTRWICNKYTDRIRSNPTWPVKSLAQTIEKEWTCKVSMPRVFRAKKRALDLIEGTTNEQFGMLYAYVEEVMSSNPGTRVVIKAMPVVGSENLVKFKRPVIGIDGAISKGPMEAFYSLMLMQTMVVYGVVEKEKKKTWLWFLQLVGEDLDIVNSHAWTFMSDKQKGLIDAVSELFPNASHRFCVRHLYNNFKGNFKGLVLKDILWKASRATSIPAFRNAKEEMKKADLNAYKRLCERPPINWSRSHFSTFPKCDILLNNLSESFNSAILIARDQSIISMLERIRHILTEMVVKRRRQWRNAWVTFAPKYTSWRWDLDGNPCIHAVAAYNLFDQEPLDHVHQCYSKATYLKTYDNMLAPLNGKELWTTSLTQVMLSPDVCRRVGRPKKARRREPEEEATVPPDPSVQETANATMGSGIKLPKTKPKSASKLTVKRQMNKTKHNQVEQNKGLTLSQPQYQVDDPVPS